ncbi:hypothetical protein PbB2_02089 [Candidatus Phycosocius bacilliformis]|uniref:Lipoprotein n=1 Tax=Candidatus Phycosocius bacilliformis TaxID=1445552 RepID=A0A2P2EBF9_9PROT|nr:hypothetical protein [Candidatus Phycosocius bacilliformis]GBF58407.1 hypothetical protein PbB2_02089 [Candidatus Phycosocius bacilliformis]
MRHVTPMLAGLPPKRIGMPLVAAFYLFVSGCVAPSGFSNTVPNPDDAKYHSPNCRAMRAMASDHDFRAASRTGLAIAAETSRERLRELPSTRVLAAEQERGALITAGMTYHCTS